MGMKKVAGVTVVLALAGFVGYGVYGLVRSGKIAEVRDNIMESVESVLPEPESDLKIIQEKCSHIATVAYEGTTTVSTTVSKDFLWWTGTREVWIEFPARAVTGIDASRIQQTIVGNTITITIPRATVLNVKCDEEKLSVEGFTVENKSIRNWWVKVGADVQTELLAKGVSKVRNIVESSAEMMERAQLEAKGIIQGYIDTINAQRRKPYKVMWRLL